MTSLLIWIPLVYLAGIPIAYSGINAINSLLNINLPKILCLGSIITFFIIITSYTKIK